MNELTFFITKASESDGVRRWDAKVSEFAVDKQNDEVTPEFYQHAADSIAKGTHPAPALVVSHIDDTSPERALEPTPDVFAAGWATEIYVDGDIPKARGVFVDNPLGNATYEAIKADIDNNMPDDERARISMAWYPEKGGIEKAGDVRRHKQGVIKHFAVTRVPIVETTDITLKSDEIKKTKLEDATTIIGEELAGELVEAYDARQVKSATFEKSEPEDTEIVDAVEVDTAPDEKAEVEVEETVEKAMRKPTQMAACIENHVRDGKTREEAINLCLKDAKKNGVQIQLPIKSGTGDEVVVKQIFSTHGKQRTYPAGGGGGGFGPFPRKEKINDCIDRLMRETNMPYDAARETCESRHTKRLGLTSRADFETVVSKPDMEYETMDECVREYMDEGMSEEPAQDHCREGRMKKAELVEKPKLGAPMGECIQSYIKEGMKKDQAVAICLSKERKAARKKAGHEEGEVDAVLRALLTDDEMEYVASEEVMKSEADGNYPASHYLVTVDPKKPTTWHLPIRDLKGNVDEGLMAKAFETLQDGSYKGPMKSEAISRLESLYEEEQFPYPIDKAFLEHAPLEDILLVELLKSEAAIDSLMEELLEMTDKAHGDSAQPTDEAVDAENVEVEETAKSETEETVKAEDAEVSEDGETPEKAETEPEAEEIEQDVEKAETGESEDEVVADAVPKDVNESDETEEVVKSETVSEASFERVDAIVTEIKAALADPTLDRSGQVLIMNTLLKQLGTEVDSEIKQTPPSSNDAAEAFKSGIVEVVDPMLEQIEQLKKEKADLKAMLDASDWGGVVKPRPEQLKFKGVQKSDAEENESGARTADQVAAESVSYQNRPIY